MTTLMCDEKYALSDELPRGANRSHMEGSGLAISSPTCWHHWAIDELEQIRLRSEGWDGDQAPRPDRIMVASARGFVDFLAENFPQLSAPYIALSPNSTVIFTWKKDQQTLDLEFKNSNTVNYYFKDRASNNKQPGTLRHKKCDAFILSQLKEFTSSDICEYTSHSS